MSKDAKSVTQIQRALNNATYQITDQVLNLSAEDRVHFIETLGSWIVTQRDLYAAAWKDRKDRGDI